MTYFAAPLGLQIFNFSPKFSYKTMLFYSTGSRCFEKQELLCHSFHLPKKAVFEKVRFHDSFDVSLFTQISFFQASKGGISLEKLELLCLSFCLSRRAVYGEMRFSYSFTATSLMHISNFSALFEYKRIIFYSKGLRSLESMSFQTTLFVYQKESRL